MKKQLLIVPAAIAASLAFPASVLAATSNSTFNVTASLTSVCSVTTVGTPVIAFGTYTAFGAAIGPVAVSAPATFQCTRGLPQPTASYDVAGGGPAGVIVGLQYTLSAPAGSKTTTGTAASAGSTGSADVYSYSFSGSIAAGQAGDPTQNPGPDVRTLIISY
jgi:hypothetical protein